MEKFVGKTLDTLNSFLSGSASLLQNPESNVLKTSSLTVDVPSFVRKIKSSHSSELEEVIKSYCCLLEKRLSDPDISNFEIQEIIQMCMTCELLGYKTPFVYIHCLKLAQKGSLKEKCIGYCAASVFLHPNHDLVILLINTIQKDLKSTNYVEVNLALTAICNLINSENAQNMIPLVEAKLKHEKAYIRKTAILTLGHCLRVVDSECTYQMCLPNLQKALTDSELEVVSATVSVFYRAIRRIPGDFSYLLTSLLNLQEQVLLRRVPRDVIYCDIPAPWLQIDILRLINHLCTKREHYEEVTPILRKTLQQISLQNTLSHAIMHELIETVTNMEPCPELVESILSAISMFLRSKSTNLKLTGIEALILVVKRLKPVISVSQQEIITECLKLPDQTLQLKTLELLFHLTNPSNVQAICKKMFEFMVHTSDPAKKKELTSKILQLSLRFSDKHEWFVSTVISVFIEAERSLSPSEFYSIVNKISEDSTLRDKTKRHLLDISNKEGVFTGALLKLASSVLPTPSDFEPLLPLLPSVCDTTAVLWTLTALTEAILKTKEIPPNLSTSLKSLELKDEFGRQALHQILQVIEVINDLTNISFEEKIDPSLSFLDDFVVESLEKNAACYVPLSLRTIGKHNATELVDSTSLFESSEQSVSQCKSITYSEFSSPSTSFQSLSIDKETDSFVNSNTLKTVWSEEGRKTESLSEGDFTLLPQEVQESNDEMKELFAGVS